MRTVNAFKWTPEDKAKVAELMKEGLSAGRICKHFGVTRNSICGLVARDEQLKAIGLRGQRFGGKKRVLTDEQRKENARRASREKYWRRKNGQKFVRPAITPKAPEPKPEIRQVISVDEWLAQNGGPRRFERGFSTDYYSIRQYLAERGVRFESHMNRLKLYRGDRARAVTWPEVHALVDEYRTAEGLTPILRSAA